MSGQIVCGLLRCSILGGREYINTCLQEYIYIYMERDNVRKRLKKSPLPWAPPPQNLTVRAPPWGNYLFLTACPNSIPKKLAHPILVLFDIFFNEQIISSKQTTNFLRNVDIFDRKSRFSKLILYFRFL